MRPYRPFLLVLYASVVFINSRTTGVIIMPAIAKEDVYLVGYSSNLTSETINCVSSSYRGLEDGWVKRTLDFNYIWGGGRWQRMAVFAYVKWPNNSIDVEVRKTGALLSMTHAEPKYQIRYYNNNSLVLSHPIRKTWGEN
ncbi:japanin-like-RA1 isoform X2 [Dermacentor variabilis]|uniref:japanin-like-RA1 isoform X2 n=1 Tax=Dermacentor variabilis TaxID=34621 RepID=UPI003F5CB6C7